MSTYPLFIVMSVDITIELIYGFFSRNCFIRIYYPMTQIATKTNNSLEGIITDYLSTIQTKKGERPTDVQTRNFLMFCLAANLNPFKNQAYLVGYDSKNGPSFSTIVAVDGYRAIAHRTGLYCGGESNIEVDDKGFPISATYVARKLIQSHICSFQAVVYYDESVQTTKDFSTGEQVPNSMWSKRPKGQLIKCAEAAALRMAFPEDLSGTYVEDELTLETLTVDQEVIGTKATNDQIDTLIDIVDNVARLMIKDPQEYLKGVLKLANIETLDELTKSQASGLINQFIAKQKQLRIDNKATGVTAAFSGAGQEIIDRLNAAKAAAIEQKD